MKYKATGKTYRRLSLVLIILIGCVVIGTNFSAVKGFFGWEHDQEPTDDSAKQQARQEAAQQGILILVNKQHPLDKEDTPDDLTAMKYFVANRSAEGRFMRAAAAAAFTQLVEAADQDGIELRMTTAYRSYEFQKRLYDNYVNQYGEEEANRFSAKPGQSEHQTGLSVDVSSSSVDYELTEAFGDTAEGKWMATHAHEFGFILRYPEGKEDVTGYLYEPWHLRYVGLFVANEIYSQNITLEEYLLEYQL
jgi:zinc D-Ala-D-Ala carboxypeptidase